MGTKRKSLAEELAELYNPAPTTEYDPDGLDLGDGAKLASDDELDGTRGPSRHAPEKAMLLRGDIELEDAAYRGRKTSRAAVFGQDDEEGSEDGDDADGDEAGLDLDLGGSDEGDSEDDGDGDDEERRAAAARAGPSGRAAAAAAVAGRRIAGGAKAANGKAAHGGRANGAPHSGSEPGSSDLELDLLRSGEEDEDEDGDADLGLEGASDEDGGEEPDDNEEEEEEEEEEPAGRRPAKRQRGAAGAAAGAGGAGGGGELEALEAEYEALAAEDEAQLDALRQKGERDRVKGLAVRNQQVLYERALEQRILLQRCLQASNGLPRPETHAALLRTRPDVKEGFAQLASAAREALSQLLDLQRTLMARNPAITLPPPQAAAAAAPAAEGAEGAANGASTSGLDTDALWGRISGQYSALAPFRDGSLDSWHRRTVLSSGSGALRNSGLRALNQSISSQVAALTRDPAKFIKRTRLTLSACPRVLCEPPRAGAAAADPLGDGGADGAAAGRQGDGPAAAVASGSVAVDVVEEERDPETYDDSEFYQQLLKEFLDKGLAAGAAAAAPKAAKKRKQVDRRASKGRKLRYHVQEKLVAFMAPVDFEPPPFAANLFSNLFGHAGK